MLTCQRITNISLAMNGGDYMKGAEWGCNFEREAFHKSATKVRTFLNFPFLNPKLLPLDTLLTTITGNLRSGDG